jgi:hypothetical protein
MRTLCAGVDVMMTALGYLCLIVAGLYVVAPFAIVIGMGFFLGGARP